MSSIRNVIMDLGGVMLEWNPDQLLTPFEPEPHLRQQLRARIFGHDWHQFDRGHVDEAELVERLVLNSGQTRSRLLEIIDAVRESLREKSETVALVRALQRRGLEIFCLSNMPGPMYAHLQRRHTFWDVFRGIVISGHIQMMKPEPAIYLHLLERFNLKAAESVFVDDMQVNVEAARGVGLHAIRFENAAQCEGELEALLASA
jgi:putative hydrolase of the HAD superfamily